MSPSHSTAPPRLSEVISLVSNLPRAEQLELYGYLDQFLADGVGERPSRASEQSDAQRLSLECLAKAYDHFGLAKTARLTIVRYHEARRALSLRLTARQISSLFRSWRTAIDCYQDERLPVTPLQYKLLHEPRGRKPDQAFARFALEQFLAESADVTTGGYARWAHAHNKHDPDRRVPASVQQITEPLSVTRFADAIRLVRGEDVKTTWRDEDYGFLVSRPDIGQFVGPSSSVVNRRTFPKPIIVNDRARFWLKDEVVAWRDGTPATIDRAAILREILPLAEVAKMLRYDKSGFHRLALNSAGRQVPAPALAHRAGYFWLRKDVEAWMRLHPEKRGRSKE
jgi:predicted DNA-binding transcriptional regulator AlpA